MKQLENLDAKTALGQNITKLRKKNNLSQGDLAEAIHVSQKTMSLIENGKTWPEHPTIKALAAVFKVEETDLFTDPAVLSALDYVLKRNS